MPPRKTTAAQEGKSAAVDEISQGQVTIRACAQGGPEFALSTVSSATPPALGVRMSEPSAPQLSVGIQEM